MARDVRHVATRVGQTLSWHEMRALVTAILAAAVLVAARPASAHPSRAEAQALEHLDRGVAAYRAGELALAEHELEAAQQLVPDKPNPYRWLALTEAQLGDCQAALVHVEDFLSRVPAGDPRAPELVKVREHCVLELQAGRAPPPHRAGPATPPPRATTPISHRWWFWTAIGAVALTAAGATYVLVHDDGPAQLPVVTCGTTGCMP